MGLGFMRATKTVISAAETWKSPCLRILMKCRKTGPKPFFETELLSKAMLQTQAVFDQRRTTISFMLLTDANACFSSLIIFSVNQLIVQCIKLYQMKCQK